MNYLFVLWSDESLMEGASPEQMKQSLAMWTAFTDSMRDAGVYVAGEGLTSSSSATTISVRDGQRIVSDGPFAETKEQILGFYLVNVGDLDEAMSWAEKVPSTQFGGRIEIRPIMDYDAIA
jgi:hypothetical protein